MGKLIDRYIARLIFLPLVSSLAVAAMVLILLRMSELFSLVFDDGGTATTMVKVLSDLMPQYLALCIPLGLLLGVLLAFRRLTLAGELDAMLSTCFSHVRLLNMPMLYAAILAIGTILLVGWVQPWSNYAYEKLLFDLEHGSLGVAVKVGEFTTLGDGLVIRANEAKHDGRDLAGIFATKTVAGGTIVLVADRASLLPAADGTIVVRLYDGTRAQIGPDGKSAATRFDVYDLSFKLPRSPAFRGRGDRGHEREWTLDELVRMSGDLQIPQKIEVAAKAGLYRRITQVLVLFFLPLLAVGLARAAPRSSSDVGLFVALALFIIYNELSLFAERLGSRGYALQGVLLAGFAGVTLLLFGAAAFRVGEPPLRWLTAMIARALRSREKPVVFETEASVT